jgi:hypothetical protein
VENFGNRESVHLRRNVAMENFGNRESVHFRRDVAMENHYLLLFRIFQLKN